MYDKEVYHFLFLHFPIGLFITGFIFHIFYILNHSVEVADKIKEYIHWTMGMGIIWSDLSVITGFITALELEYLDSIYYIVSNGYVTENDFKNVCNITAEDVLVSFMNVHILDNMEVNTVNDTINNYSFYDNETILNMYKFAVKIND